MNSNKYRFSEVDIELQYYYHLLALKNGWGLGFRHIQIGGLSRDSIHQSGYIPFYEIYNCSPPLINSSNNIIHTEQETICNINGQKFTHTIIAKKISDFIFTHWNFQHINLALNFSRDHISELILLNKQKFGEQDNLIYQKVTAILELKQQEKQEEIQKMENSWEERKRQQEERKKQEEERKRQQEEKQFQKIEEIKRKQEEILVKYEYYFKGISKQKSIFNLFGINYGYYPWYKDLRSKVENEYYYLCDKEKLAILLAKAYMFVYKDRPSLEDRVSYANCIETAKKYLYKMNKNMIPVVPI